MNARRVSAAAGVVAAALVGRDSSGAGIAAALEAAGLLQSPESAAELVALRARVAELEAEAYGDAAVRLVDPVSQIRHLHACVAAQRSRADVLDRLCGKYQERADLVDGSPWERAVAGLNALVDADVIFHVEPDGHISAPASDEHIEWDLKAKRWVLTHDDEDEDEDVPPAPAVSADDEARAAVDRSVKAQYPVIAAFLAEDPQDSPLHHSYAVGRDLPEVKAESPAESVARWNAAHFVGTPVTAYPGRRPEDDPKCVRLITHTRSAASVLGGHTAVVWVEGHGACIKLTHVDPRPGGAL
ncbi:hypothetical protein [Streptomyces cyaneofuscatus]|uniref:hypothetical protein n=1 Tax=Streptomyces cyaneofuscatus TaxID=66883 RepID=UPI00363A6091